MPYLVCINDDGETIDRWEIGLQSLIAGRGDDCEILLADQRASRRHFEITPREGRYFIRDLNSANGTFLNDQKLSEEKVLIAGDRIRVGSITMRFEMGKSKGLATVISELQKESEESGKGFRTMIREISKNTP